MALLKKDSRLKSWMTPWLLASFLLVVVKGAKVKVFLLLGQSNMEGSGHISHLNHLVKESPSFHKYWNETTYDFVTRPDVRITFNRNFGEAADLSIGYGFDPKDRFGPEVGFGWTVQDKLQEEQILIIKCATGGTHLGVEWQSPTMKQRNPQSYDGFVAEKYGELWDMTFDMVEDVVANTNKYLPGSTAEDGIEIAGIVFFQGWNDAFHDGLREDYKTNLKWFITDLLSTYGSNAEHPLPIIIGELGQEGNNPSLSKLEKMRVSQRAAIREISKRNVVLAKTSQYVYSGHPEPLDGIHHYWGHADTIMSIGNNFGHVILDVMGYTRSPTRKPSQSPSAAPSRSPSSSIIPTNTPSDVSRTNDVASLRGSDASLMSAANKAFYYEIIARKSKATNLSFSVNVSIAFAIISMMVPIVLF